MPRDERTSARNDQVADLQCSITATLTYIMGLASMAELFGLQGYLSKLASQMTPPDVGNQRLPPMPEVLSQQLAEMERQQKLMRAQQSLANATPAQFRQEG